jgi:hypothetical protein
MLYYQSLSVDKNTVTIPLKKNTEICQQRHILHKSKTRQKTVTIF